MYICINDGKAIFATHLIKLTSPERVQEALPFHREGTTLILYSENELAQAESMVRALGLKYVIEEVNCNSKHIAKSDGVKYQSRSEAISHLKEDKLPVSVREKAKDREISSLRKELEELKEKINLLKL